MLSVSFCIQLFIVSYEANQADRPYSTSTLRILLLNSLGHHYPQRGFFRGDHREIQLLPCWPQPQVILGMHSTKRRPLLLGKLFAELVINRLQNPPSFVCGDLPSAMRWAGCRPSAGDKPQEASRRGSGGHASWQDYTASSQRFGDSTLGLKTVAQED